MKVFITLVILFLVFIGKFAFKDFLKSIGDKKDVGMVSALLLMLSSSLFVVIMYYFMFVGIYSLL